MLTVLISCLQSCTYVCMVHGVDPYQLCIYHIYACIRMYLTIQLSVDSMEASSNISVLYIGTCCTYESLGSENQSTNIVHCTIYDHKPHDQYCNGKVAGATFTRHTYYILVNAFIPTTLQALCEHFAIVNP